MSQIVEEVARDETSHPCWHQMCWHKQLKHCPFEQNHNVEVSKSRWHDKSIPVLWEGVMDAVDHEVNQVEVLIVRYKFHPRMLTMEQPAMQYVFHQKEALCSKEY